MPRWTVTRKATAGRGVGGRYTYSVRADSAAEAVDKTAIKADRLHHRLNRGFTVLAAEPVDITRIDRRMTMSKPAWLKSQLVDRARAADVLGRAADQSNKCRAIADALHARGCDHFGDPTWEAAVVESRRLDGIAEADGFNGQDVMDEAARRRNTA